MLPIHQLEAYSLQYPNEVLLVSVQLSNSNAEAEPDELIIFKGFSSFLTRHTDFDPDVPLLGAGDKILTISRLTSPYIPGQSQVIEDHIHWDEMQSRLASA